MAWHRRTKRFLAGGLVQVVLTGCAAGPPGLAASGPPATTVVRSQMETPPGPQLKAPVADTAPPADPGPGDPAAIPEPTAEQVVARVRAKVNGVAILDEELKDAVYPILVQIRDMPEPQRSLKQREIIQQALDHLIEREVVLGEAYRRLKGTQGEKILEKLKEQAGKDFDKEIRSMKQRAHCATDEEFKELLRRQNQSLDGMRRQFERSKMAAEFMRFKVLPSTEVFTTEDVKNYYLEHLNEFQRVDSVKWQDVFIAAARHNGLEGARQVAQGLVNRIKAGADVARLADEFDDGDSKFRHGEGLGQHRGEIKPPEVEPYLFRMNDGEVGPLVELETGVHVIRLVTREQAGQMPLDSKLQEFILKKLKNEAADREWKRLVKKMKDEAVIEIMP